MQCIVVKSDEFENSSSLIYFNLILISRAEKPLIGLKKFHPEHALAPSADHMQMELVLKNERSEGATIERS